MIKHAIYVALVDDRFSGFSAKSYGGTVRRRHPRTAYACGRAAPNGSPPCHDDAPLTFQRHYGYSLPARHVTTHTHGLPSGN